MKITTLMEDTKTDDHLVQELGFSLFIETMGEKILLDTGRSGRFVDNSKALGIDLKHVDFCVISHAHFDHGGGLERFFQVNAKAPVYMHEKSTKDYYTNLGSKMPPLISFFVHPFIKRSARFAKRIGLDRALLGKQEKRFSYISKTTPIGTDVFLLTDITKKHPTPIANKFLLTKRKGMLEPDNFTHEMILLIKETDGLVLFSGCCHSGILNMIDTVKAHFKDVPIKAIVGGFHLVRQPGKDRMAGKRSEIESIADAFISRGIHKIYTGHCTGREAYGVLSDKLLDRINYLSCGTSFQI